MVDLTLDYWKDVEFKFKLVDLGLSESKSYRVIITARRKYNLYGILSFDFEDGYFTRGVKRWTCGWPKSLGSKSDIGMKVRCLRGNAFDYIPYSVLAGIEKHQSEIDSVQIENISLGLVRKPGTDAVVVVSYPITTVLFALTPSGLIRYRCAQQGPLPTDDKGYALIRR